jgi:phospholipid/cholesterol/gamma-HCH transport system ATP-binding protein
MPSDVILEIKNLHKTFDNKSVLRGINISLYRGEILGFFGGSGTGKSVILRTMIGLEKPDEGEIIFEGQDIAKLDERELVAIRKKIGYVFQNGALFDSMTVEENLAYPLKAHTKMPDEEIKARITEMLKLVGLEGSEKLYPANLSGGMQKRIGVARSIIIRPDIILYDEPTAGLDPYNTNRLVELMVKVKELGNTSIFVTHDLPAAFKVADRIAILYQGKIHAIDTVEKIKDSPDPMVKAFLAGEQVK